MIALSDIRSSIREIIIDQCASYTQDVVFANQASPRPARPYVTILITSISGIACPYYGDLLPNNITQPIYDDVKIMVGVQAYGTQAQDILLAVRAGLKKETSLLEIRRGGMAFIREMGVKDLSDSGAEQRAGLDLEFRGCDEIFDDIGCIETVIVDGLAKVASGLQEQPVQFTVSAPEEEQTTMEG